jgi:hypothetical protein
MSHIFLPENKIYNCKGSYIVLIQNDLSIFSRISFVLILSNVKGKQISRDLKESITECAF